MKVFKDLSQNYADCIVTYFGYEKFEQEFENFALYVGYNNCFNVDLLKENKNKFQYNVFLNDELPCSFTQNREIFSKSVDRENIFSHIFSICKFTNKWMNENFCENNKFFNNMFVMDYSNIYKNDKIFDSIFYGSVCGKEHEKCIDVLGDFKYNFVTLDPNHWYPNNETVDVSKLKKKITHLNIHTFEKWKIISQTKVMPIINKLYLHDYHVENIKKHEKWNLNEAWKKIEKKEAPQLKPRIVEASMLGCLMLVLKDEWNAIEDWFEPNKDFLYFHNFEELHYIIADVIKNYENYTYIINNAHQKALQHFTTNNMLKYYQKTIFSGVQK